MPSRILIADDEPIILDIVKEFLQSENCEVVTCQDGGEALLILEDYEPDLVLMDLMMDGVDGLMALKGIKSNEKTHHIPVIVLTAIDVGGTTGQECLDSGAFAIVEKPIDFKKLRKAIFNDALLSGGANRKANSGSRHNDLASMVLTEESLSELFAREER